MKIVILKREFEILWMKDTETIKEYILKLFEVVNKMRLLREDISDQRIS